MEAAPPDTFITRLLTPADAEAFVALRRLMLVETPWAFGASPGDDRRSDAAAVAEAMRSADQATAGAFAGAELVSVAVLVREGMLKRRHIAGIYSVYTHPSARRRGLSRGVLELLVGAARGWGVERLQLSVSDRTAGARALYESLGFREWGREEDALRIAGESADEVHMALRLKAEK